ncbi:hypothetical protein B0H14DRAFT_3143403 [Mycena olivaceomarginata]|nr:hypothetical protein B0H14DRAFT_3143403 [Mycena olivaceomarginata]
MTSPRNVGGAESKECAADSKTNHAPAFSHEGGEHGGASVMLASDKICGICAKDGMRAEHREIDPPCDVVFNTAFDIWMTNSHPEKIGPHPRACSLGPFMEAMYLVYELAGPFEMTEVRRKTFLRTTRRQRNIDIQRKTKTRAKQAYPHDDGDRQKSEVKVLTGKVCATLEDDVTEPSSGSVTSGWSGEIRYIWDSTKKEEMVEIKNFKAESVDQYMNGVPSSLKSCIRQQLLMAFDPEGWIAHTEIRGLSEALETIHRGIQRSSGADDSDALSSISSKKEPALTK